MGRYEEALAAFDERIVLGREMGRPVRVILNYSTVALRDIYDLDEARRRNEEALEQMGWSSFNMPWHNALVDLIFDDLLAGEIGSAETRWPKVWADISAGKAWQRWMLVGKMMEARAELAVHLGRYDEAIEWAHQAMEMAQPVGRTKYEIAASITSGRAMIGMGKAADALQELRLAVTQADRLGTPAGRWQARAALGEALAAIGHDDEAGSAYGQAIEIIDDVASGLAPERARGFLSAEPIRTVLRMTG
jgi:tetratricopeptide (TPR) repeat protein